MSKNAAVRVIPESGTIPIRAAKLPLDARNDLFTAYMYVRIHAMRIYVLPILAKNIRANMSELERTDREPNREPQPAVDSVELTVRICVKNLRIVFDKWNKNGIHVSPLQKSLYIILQSR